MTRKELKIANSVVTDQTTPKGTVGVYTDLL